MLVECLYLRNWGLERIGGDGFAHIDGVGDCLDFSNFISEIDFLDPPILGSGFT